MNINQLITIVELESFKKELIEEFKRIAKELKGPQGKKWLKSAEVRKLLGLSPGKLQTMRQTGLITYTQIGAVIYYDLDDVYKMFEKYKVVKVK